MEDGIVKIVFVKSINNDADIFTKNTGGEIHNAHVEKFSEELDEETSANGKGVTT